MPWSPAPARSLLAALLAFGVPTLPLLAQEAAHAEVKYVRDAEEYATLTRQVYRLALAAVTDATRGARAGTWAVALDVDETALDNSAYQLERFSYGQPFGSDSWNAWVVRGEAGVVPGVQEFIAGVRRLGGRVAWISNRDDRTRAATQGNLARVGLWSDADRICLAGDTAYTKAVRRAELAEGRGACGWSGTPVRVAAFVGDQMGDFPAAGEADADAGKDEAFGRRYFLLPNPMYGAWATRVTRRR